jgi:putative oxidoreductase
MHNFMRRLFDTPRDIALTILRLTLGLVFLAHGSQKMLGWFGGAGFSATMGLFESSGIPTVFAFLAIAAEFFGGLGLILGLLTRIAAFGIFCTMVVAILKVHAVNGLFMNWTGRHKGEGFEFHLLVLAICVALMWRGAGAASADRAIALRMR